MIALLGVAVIGASLSDNEPAAAAPQTASAVEAPATIPPSTTAPPPTTALPVGDTLPAGPTERPTGLVAGVFYDTLVGVGVDPGIARCAADDLLANTSEADLLAHGHRGRATTARGERPPRRLGQALRCHTRTTRRRGSGRAGSTT